jgi:class 3 adenylate cyclase/tetratricopeptide (TPR) repeat protein
MVVCRACGSESAEGSRFCSDCGAAIVAPGRSSERRIVTALFCDLVGFTAFSESADPEDVDALLRAFGTLVREVSASFGGLVEKFIGDAVVAVFGVPVAHEDDPERAVRAGLRILERLSELPSPEGEAVRARIGINTGRALIHLDVDPMSGQGFMVGDAVNTAARLQSIAPPMAVVVGEATHGLTAGLFDYQQLAPVELKGKAAPASPWLARRPLTRTGVEARVQRSALTGREVELATLARHVDEILAGGSPRLVLLVGDAGIGKSRLVYELSRYTDGLPELFRWRTGFSQPFGQTTPFRALAQIVQAHAAILESDAVTDVERKLDAMLNEAGDKEWLATRLRPLLGLDAPPAGPEENVAAWERVVEEMTAHGPAILVFEDLHWADEGLLGFLTGLMDHVAQVPLLVLATARPEVLGRAPGLAAPGPRSSRLPVRNLERRHLERLIESLLGDAGLPADLVQVVRGHCGGNPLYIEEFVRFLSEAGPTPSDGRSPPAPAGLPDTLEALIAARLDVLPRRCREVLGDASVMGLEFWRGAVASLEQTGSEDVDRELGELVERELVRALPASTVEGDAQYVFRHAAIRDVAYGQLPRAVRAAKHAGVAGWLEDAAGERLDEVAGILAHHWVTALEHSRAARDERLAEATLEPAVRSLIRAGDHALALDVAIAESRYRQALELAPADSPERPRLLVRWARALMEDGRMDAALRAFDDGITGLKTQGDHVATALALGSQSTALQLVGDMVRSGRALQEALALLAGERSAARVDLLGQWAGHCMVMADEGEAARVAGETLELAAELGMPTPVLALVARASSRCGSCDERGFDDHAAALAAATEQGLGRETSVIYFNWAEDIGSLHGPRAALRRFGEGLRFAQSRKDRAMSFSLTYGIVRDLFRSGQWTESLEEARALVPQLKAAHNLSELAYVTTVEAGLLVAQGEFLEAQSLLPTLEETACGPGEPLLRAACLVSAAAVRCAIGEAQASRRLLASCAGLSGLGEEYGIDWHVPGAVRHASALRDEALARQLATLAKEGRPLHRRVAPTVRALLYELDGDDESASRQFAEAAAGWSELGVPFEAALAQLGQGRCLLALGRAKHAASPLHEAHETLSGLGALPDAEIARTLADKASSP